MLIKIFTYLCCIWGKSLKTDREGVLDFNYNSIISISNNGRDSFVGMAEYSGRVKEIADLETITKYIWHGQKNEKSSWLLFKTLHEYF